MTTLGTDGRMRTPTGMRVAPSSYAKLEDVAENLRPLLPKVPGSRDLHIDGWRTLEQMLRKAGYEPHVADVDVLKDVAAFAIPERGRVVVRRDIYDGLFTGSVFSTSTVVHEVAHIVLEHAVTLHRGPPGEHSFCEDSEWQAKALTAAVMMPISACRAAASPVDLARMCATSVQAATYRIERLVKARLIPPKQYSMSLFE